MKINTKNGAEKTLLNSKIANGEINQIIFQDYPNRAPPPPYLTYV